MSTLNFQNDGVEIVSALLTEDEMEEVKADIDLEDEKLRTYGIRNLEKRFSSIRRIAGHTRLRKLADERLGTRAWFVRALFFDKTPEKNWSVDWHQDCTVTLNKRIDEADWGPSFVKDGVCHVQPPVTVLERMITLRLHLDAADEDGGCLEVIPGSHNSGVLGQLAIAECVACAPTAHCAVCAGDAVIMRPLVLHRSRIAKRPSHRRVVHLEFSGFELPNGASWA